MTRADRAAQGLAGVGLAMAALGWLLDAPGFYGAWLAALTLASAWPLGSVAVLMVHALTGGRWGEVLAPALRLGVCSLPLLVIAALPLIPGLAPLYPWARPDAGRHFGNTFYLNPPFFAARAVLYLVVWLVLAGLVLQRRHLRAVAPAGLFVLAVTTTFAAIDATMSLDPHFTSSIYGMINAAGMGLTAVAAAVLLTARAAPPEVRADLGKLLLALSVLWIYLDFMQLLIVWQSDLAAEAPWYLQRARGLWGAVWIAVAAGHFVLPFALLLSPRMQRSPGVLTGVAVALLAASVLRAWWTVLPSLDRGIGWIAVAAMAGLCGAAFAVARLVERRTPVEVRHV